MAFQTVSNPVASRTFISTGASFEVLLRGAGAARVMSAAHKDIRCPQIDLSRHEYFRGTGRLITSDAGELPEVEFSVIMGGRVRNVLGAAVALPQGLDVRLPLGFVQAPVVQLH